MKLSIILLLVDGDDGIYALISVYVCDGVIIMYGTTWM